MEKCKQEGVLLPSSQASLHGAEALLAQSLDRRSLMMVLAVRYSVLYLHCTAFHQQGQPASLALCWWQLGAAQ